MAGTEGTGYEEEAIKSSAGGAVGFGGYAFHSRVLRHCFCFRFPFEYFLVGLLDYRVYFALPAQACRLTCTYLNLAGLPGGSS